MSFFFIESSYPGQAKSGREVYLCSGDLCYWISRRLACAMLVRDLNLGPVSTLISRGEIFIGCGVPKPRDLSDMPCLPEARMLDMIVVLLNLP